ncbi:MAG: YeiH family putative sulfate export transporter [Gammaproteobacteria bacterium]|nr:YeiH family putative sulfate export transporter [Gammaproteobacteria bacterium]
MSSQRLSASAASVAVAAPDRADAAARRTGWPFTGTSGIARLLPGLVLTTAIASLAWQIGRVLPLLGAPVCGILLGIAVGNLFTPSAVFLPGVRFVAKHVLQWSIVLLGFGLSLVTVAHTGVRSLAVTAVTMTTAFLAAWALGRVLRVPDHLKVLIGVGTAICGGSAIAAVAPVIRADEHDTAFAISTIFLFNLVAVLVFPIFGHWLHLSDLGFGMWAGTAVNDTSSVVAVAYGWSHVAGDFATIVKLTRSTLIIPVCLVLAIVESVRHRRNGVQLNLARVFPWFILWFLAASAVRTAGWIPAGWLPGIATAATFLIVMALSSIGLSADLRRIAATGIRPILLGTGVWIAVAVSSLVVQGVLGQR